MLKRRLVPVLFLRHGWMVRSENFAIHQAIGNPVVHVERMAQWDVDELIVLDISSGDKTEFRHLRDDYRQPGATDLLRFIETIANECRIPLTFGGRLRTVDDVGSVIRHGADKVTVNTAALADQRFVTECARVFGSQAIVVSIDYRVEDGMATVFGDHGSRRTDLPVVEWAKCVADAGAGEILINAIDRDGRAVGYDLETIDAVVSAVDIPVIACGGAGHIRHFSACFLNTGASAVAAGNIFHFTENAYPRAKQTLRQQRNDIR